jgi:hypothetical protein
MKSKGVAFLWDESFLWGLMAYKALKGLGLPFDLIRSEDVKAGALDEFNMLFVPGGWASNKSRALGDAGRKAIRDFVAGGGSYLGFCGGAGLATEANGGIGLLNVKRRPTRERVPSFSGRIGLYLNEHMIWSGIKNPPPFAEEGNSSPITHHPSPVFHAWWPSQLVVDDDNVKVLATYGDALPDAFSSDLNVGDTEVNGGWKRLEEIYRINLDPKRLVKEPAIIEGGYGKGKVILSLIHFDTPDDRNGQHILANLWKYLGGQKPESRAQNPEPRQQTTDHRLKNEEKTPPLRRECESLSSEICALCSDLISLGERNFLWFWRNPMLLQWRRGVRGLEYNTLYIMAKEIAEQLQNREERTKSKDRDKNLKSLMDILTPFVEKAKRLLIMERHALQQGHHITYEKCDDAEIKKIRGELFSNSKSHGGIFKELLDKLDDLLFSLIKGEESR